MHQELPLRTVAVPGIRPQLWREANDVVLGVHAPGTSAADSRCIRQLLWREANDVVPGACTPGTSTADCRCIRYPSTTFAEG
jgi:hypothetical protein